MINVAVKGALEIDVEELPDGALDLLKGSLSFHNEDKETAQREEIPGWWDMPDTIDLWRVEKRRSGKTIFVSPRGHASKLIKLLMNLGEQVKFDDQRNSTPAADGYFLPFVLRDYQLDAVMAVLKATQGFYEAPAGAGKTVSMLGAMAYANLRTLVVVDKADLLDQWRERAEEFLNLSIDFEDERSSGKMGMDVWEERDFTVALRQTLWSRIDDLDATKWWDTWGMTIYDEGHHLTADTLSEVSKRCSSQIMLGTSATPARTEVKGEIVQAIVGPIVHRTPRKVLREKGILVTPEVRRVETEFSEVFWKTHKVGAGKKCDKPDCDKQNAHKHRNNYTSVVKKLTEDEDRNIQIAEEIMAERGHVHLVPSRQLKHLKFLRQAIEEAGWDGPIFYLRGEENARGESREIVQQIREADEAVIFSTVADEGLDVPPIDRVHIVFPLRQSGLTEQIIGRGERSWPGKESAVIVDYVDVMTEPLLEQSYVRMETYRRLELKITRQDPVRFDSGDFSSFSPKWPITTEHPLMPETDIEVLTREHLFQAMKTLDRNIFDYVMAAPTASEAKKRGRELDLRPDWEEIKYGIMLNAIHQQCAQNPELVQILQATGEREIIEARPDPIWGEGKDGNGQNLLGKCWMEARDYQRRKKR